MSHSCKHIRGKDQANFSMSLHLYWENSEHVNGELLDFKKKYTGMLKRENNMGNCSRSTDFIIHNDHKIIFSIQKVLLLKYVNMKCHRI